MRKFTCSRVLLFTGLLATASVYSGRNKVLASHFSTVKAHTNYFTGHSISIRKGDLTKENSDAIVNAANSHLRHGGGLAAAIQKAGGPTIQEESAAWIDEHGVIPTGHVAVTSAGYMPSGIVIHAVGPVWQGGDANEAELLSDAVWNSLLEAKNAKAHSIAIPAISSGIFGFPKQQCANIIIQTVVDYCEKNPHVPPTDIRLTNWDDETVDIFLAAFLAKFPNAKKDEL